MSTPQPPLDSPTIKDEAKSYATSLHRMAIVTLIVAPVLAALPPRKMDTYTVGLVGLTVFSGNYLYRESRGHSIWHVIGGSEAETIRSQKSADVGLMGSLPTEKAKEFQRQLREVRARQARAEGKVVPEENVEERKKEGLGIVEQAFYGSEKPEGWRERRAREDQEKLASGKGYGDIIMEQIWDVWTWNYGDKKKGEGETSETGKKE